MEMCASFRFSFLYSGVRALCLCVVLFFFSVQKITHGRWWLRQHRLYFPSFNVCYDCDDDYDCGLYGIGSKKCSLQGLARHITDIISDLLRLREICNVSIRLFFFGFPLLSGWKTRELAARSSNRLLGSTGKHCPFGLKAERKCLDHFQPLKINLHPKDDFGGPVKRV